MTIEQARKLVRGYTSGMTAEQVEATATRMLETGECVWHAASVVCNALAKCMCRDCRPDIKRYI
jgi:hypothetical protein